MYTQTVLKEIEGSIWDSSKAKNCLLWNKAYTNVTIAQQGDVSVAVRHTMLSATKEAQ